MPDDWDESKFGEWNPFALVAVDRDVYDYWEKSWRKKTKEFRAEIETSNPAFALQAKIGFYKYKIYILEQSILNRYKIYKYLYRTLPKEEVSAYMQHHIQEIRKCFYKIDNLKKVIAESLFPTGEGKFSLSRAIIEEAREVKIKNIYPVKRNMAKCLVHKPDSKPSMSVRGNRAYCFSCGFKCDVIEFAMILHNLNFRDAVLYLVSESRNGN